ncbi:MAG: hypothetical protein EA406_09890 [Rhodospirillales bacterium]|nr:MAG: hypothetical protein EA406_09890 [Rhodospirillales bacterium]
MPPSETGWAWLDTAPSRADDCGDGTAAAPDRPAGPELARAFARCFRTDDGETVLCHLRGLTVERAVGPDVSDQALRFLEGQRQLVNYVTNLVKRGHGGPRGRVNPAALRKQEQADVD